jgi:uncharacterized protein
MSGSFLSIVHIDKKIKYDGSQLAPHWIYKNYNTIGDVAACFIGPCDIPYKFMVDIEDIINKDTIFSNEMLHFVVEIFNKNIMFSVLFQNIIISLIQNVLLSYNINVVKKGDDLFVNDKKLSISIATASIMSALIHIGINIDSNNTPVKTISLNDLNIDINSFKNNILYEVNSEYKRIILASSKVKPVY